MLLTFLKNKKKIYFNSVLIFLLFTKYIRVGKKLKGSPCRDHLVSSHYIYYPKVTWMPSVVRSSLPPNIAYSALSNTHDLLHSYCVLEAASSLFPSGQPRKILEKELTSSSWCFPWYSADLPTWWFQGSLHHLFPGKVSPGTIILYSLSVPLKTAQPELNKVASDQPTKCQHFSYCDLAISLSPQPQSGNKWTTAPFLGSVTVLQISIICSCVLLFTHSIRNSLREASTIGLCT